MPKRVPAKLDDQLTVTMDALTDDQNGDDIVVGNIIKLTKITAGTVVWTAEVEIGDHMPEVISRTGNYPLVADILAFTDAWLALTMALDGHPRN